MQVMQKAINTCPDCSSKNISNALEGIISCSLWAEESADTNTSTACTKSRGAGCENKHMDAVQRNKLNIHSVGTEMKSLAANTPNHRVQFTLLRPVWNVKHEGGSCSLQRCCCFLTASRGLVVSAGFGFSVIALCVGVRAFWSAVYSKFCHVETV